MTSFLDAIVCCRDVVEEANKSGKIVKQAVAWTVNTLYAVWAKKAGTAAKFEALVKAQGAPEEIFAHPKSERMRRFLARILEK